MYAFLHLLQKKQQENTFVDSNNNVGCKDFTPDQSALLLRVLGRMKKLHNKLEPLPLALALRANDMPPESLQQVRDWLEAHKDDPAEEDPRGAKYLTAKPATATDPGADEESKGCEKDMAGNTATAPAQQDMAWILRMDEEAKKGGNFLKMEPNDDKTLTFLSNPVEGINEYNGQKRVEFKVNVKDSKTGEEMVWAIRQKEVMQQLVGILKFNRINSLIGITVDVSTRGPDAKTKHWFLRLANGAPAQPAPAQDPGQQWLQQQRAGVQG